MVNIDYSLMYVTDERIIDDSAFFSILENSLKGGASIIQLREKTLDTRSFYKRAVEVKKLCDQYEIPLIINDRLDIALATDAAGLHLGQKDLPVIIARKLLGPNKIIGLSISNEEQVLESNNLNIDYIGLSPVFSTTTKTNNLDNPVGLKGLKIISQRSTKPIISIGGIDKTNAAAVLQNGSNGIAVVSAISKAVHPKAAAEELKKIICQTGTKQ
jgi:thiamine-phosphate pyrophosphorylase